MTNMRRRCSSDAIIPPLRNSGSGMNDSERPSELERFHRCQGTIACFCVLHCLFVLVILIVGILKNGGHRKYVPVDPTGLANLVQSEFNVVDSDGVSCLKAYVDVHTSSIRDELAFVCCAAQESSIIETISGNPKQYRSDLCIPRLPYFNISMQQIPFSRRLTRFPEAWILPMLPILIRLFYQLISSLWSLIKPDFKLKPIRSPSTGSDSSSKSKPALEKIVLASSFADSSTSASNTKAQTLGHEYIRTTLQRILFYFAILNLRGWGLYVSANAIEDYIIVPWFTGKRVVSPVRTNSVSDVEHNIQSLNHDCWYKDVLKTHHRNEMESVYYSDCYGRPFDFSDHIVLFLAHYLPIFVMEIIYFWMFPCCVSSQHQSTLKYFITRVYSAIHMVLFLYMHVIVLQATYQTSAYFHTSTEVIVGYLISLLLQCPIFYLLYSVRWTTLRQFIGLPVEEVKKGDARGKTM